MLATLPGPPEADDAGGFEVPPQDAATAMAVMTRTSGKRFMLLLPFRLLDLTRRRCQNCRRMPKTPNLDAQVDGPQYLGPATFMKVRMLSEPEELDRVRPDVAIVGAPWDDGTTYRPGARFGPRAVRVANYQPPSWHLDLEVAPFEVLSVVDYGTAVCSPGRADQPHDAIRARVTEIASRQIVPIIIGCDHSIT